MVAADSTGIVATEEVAVVTAEAEDAIETVAVAAAEALAVTETAVAVVVTAAAVTAIVADAVVVEAAATVGAVATAVIAIATVTPCWAAIPTTAIVAGADRREAAGARPEAAGILLTADSWEAVGAVDNTDPSEGQPAWIVPSRSNPFLPARSITVAVFSAASAVLSS